MSDGDEPFLSRWSRLKRESANHAKQPRLDAAENEHAAPEAAQKRDQSSESEPEVQADESSFGKPEQPALDLDKIDFDRLDGSSDYKPFMSASVPDEIRSKALSKLWLSDPVLSGPEQLSDYMEDFTDATRAVPGGLLKTAYKVGQGFLSDEEAAEWDRLGREEKPLPPAAAQIVIGPESPDQPEVAAFLAAADAYSKSLYPPESNHLLGLAALMAPNVHFFVARRDGRALGCGALVVAEAWGEVKRMWVDPDARGQSIGRRLVEAIETTARKKSVSILRLETGIRQPEAIGLYRRCGFTECKPFGSYELDPLSIFMEKRLG